jgi:hypothetical protein
MTSEWIEMAQAGEMPPTVAAAAGKALAAVCFRRARDLDDLVLADMTADAYLAYDEETARLHQLRPDVRLKRGAVGSGN